MTIKEDPKFVGPSKKVNKKKSKRYVDVLKSSISDEENKKKENNVPQKNGISPKDNKDKFKRSFPPRLPHRNWYQIYFFGYCFYCNHFGHKMIYYRTHTRNNHVWNKDINSYEFSNINYNSFSPLFDYNGVCYKCKNYGHTTRFSRSDIVETPKQIKDVDTLVRKKKELIGVWKRNQGQEMQKKEESMLLKTSLHVQNKGNQWRVRSGCSSHMIGDRSKFLTLKEVNIGSVAF
jgi:hypothetical protein